MRKGLSKQEMMDLPLPEFCELQLFDEYLEPQSPQLDDIRHSITQANLYRSSGNLSKDGLKRMKAEDFRMFSDEAIFKTPEQLEEIKRKQEQQRIQAVNQMLTPAQLKQLKEMQRGASNGKEK
ncbi:phage tail assembly protein T [Buttiauxella gaviniae]|nr:hypothetical protein [Buttiauxella gaviniae]